MDDLINRIRDRRKITGIIVFAILSALFLIPSWLLVQNQGDPFSPLIVILSVSLAGLIAYEFVSGLKKIP